MRAMKCKWIYRNLEFTLSHWIASGLHGYCHEFVSTLSEQQQRDVMAKSVENLTDFLGKKPRGWTAPAWDTSRQTIKILEEFGIVRILPDKK